MVPAGEKFLMVENGSWGMDKSVGRVPIPFLEKDGYYNGAPADDEMAVAELERMRSEGEKFIAFGWPSFWWMEHYPRFAKYLAERFTQCIRNDDLIAFDLRVKKS